MNRGKKKQIDNEQVSRQSFEARFNRYRNSRRGVVEPVSTDQMDVFFALAEEYRRDSQNLPDKGEDRELLIDDANNSKRLMKGINDRMDKLERFILESAAPEHVATTILAQCAREKLTSFRSDLEQEFEFENRRIEAQERRLSTRLAQHAELEFTLDLLGFVRDSFSQLTETKRRRLIEAAMAGAGCFPKNEIMAGTQPRRVGMKFLRAEKYQKEMYPEGRFYAYLKLVGKKKQKAARGGEKNG
ncbi:MAG: hypothetical protein WBW53_13575 [Terriglobales bacterium]